MEAHSYPEFPEIRITSATVLPIAREGVPRAPRAEAAIQNDGGVLVLIDEMGKFLEAAAGEDIFSRSAGKWRASVMAYWS